MTKAVTEEKPAPTEAQVNAKNEATKAQWQDDFPEDELKIPYKREEDDAKKEKSGQVENKTDSSGDGGTSKDKTDEEDSDSEPTYTEPAPVVTVQDPGEFKPADYSFEIEIDGKTHKVDSSEKAEQLAEEFAETLSAKQLFALVNKGTKIERKTEQDREKWEADKKTFEEQTATAKEREETIQGMASELNYLVDKGFMPKIAKEYTDADWSDPEVAKQEGVKEQLELIKYMDAENARRTKNKVKPLTSMVDAFNAMTLDNSRKQEVDDKKKAGEDRKVASARVAGVSPTQGGSYVPKGIAVGRVLPRSGVADWDN